MAVSRPLKPVTLVRFQLGERIDTHGGRCVLECTPRCERGSAGSIPAGHPQSWGAPPNGGQLVLKTGVVVSSPRGSIPPLPSPAPVDRTVRRRAATSSHAGASPAGSSIRGQGVVRGTPGSQLGRAGAVPADRSNSYSFAPLSERLGPCLPSKREAFDSPAVLRFPLFDLPG